jgi:hypothetical protein
MLRKRLTTPVLRYVVLEGPFGMRLLDSVEDDREAAIARCKVLGRSRRLRWGAVVVELRRGHHGKGKIVYYIGEKPKEEMVIRGSK